MRYLDRVLEVGTEDSSHKDGDVVLLASLVLPGQSSGPCHRKWRHVGFVSGELVGGACKMPCHLVQAGGTVCGLERGKGNKSRSDRDTPKQRTLAILSAPKVAIVFPLVKFISIVFHSPIH